MGKNALDNNNQKFYTNRFLSFASNLLTILSYVGISLAALFGFIRKNFWMLVPIICLILLILFIRYLRKNKSKAVSFIMKLIAPAMPYKFTKCDITYEYYDNRKMSFRVVYHVKALQVDVDRINIKINWSGEDKSNPIKPVVIKDKSLENNDSDKLIFTGTEFGYAYYELCSKKKHGNGDEFVLAYEIQMKVKDKIPSPHLLCSISALTDELSMQVIFPSTLYPESAKGREYLNSTDFHPWGTRDISPARQKEDGRWILSYAPSSPIYGGKYVIEWDQFSELEKVGEKS